MRNGFCFLTDRLPTTIGNLEIDTRACTAIAVSLKLKTDAPMAEKISYVSCKLFGLPYSEALEKSGLGSEQEFDKAVVGFLSGAPKVKSWHELHADASETPTGEVSYEKRQTIPDFDFVQDSGSILAAFRASYNMTLDEICDCHWWEFLELMKNLPSDCTFSKIRDIRTRKSEPKDTPEQKQSLRKAKKAVALVDTRSPDQKRQDFQKQLNSIDL